MPHAALKLVPGTDTQETQALNENSAISQTQLIRFFPDRNGLALVQKIGGWQKFYASPLPAIVRALWAWEDLNLNAWLAVGTQTITGQDYAELAVITNGTLTNITPTQTTVSEAAVLNSYAGNSIFTIFDTLVPGVTNYDSVYIATQISIGGVVLFGLYACDPEGVLGTGAYTVQATDILGNPLPAVTTSSLPVLPLFVTTAGSSTVNVTLPGYTYAAGTTFSVLVPTEVGGITLYGNYVVQSIVNASIFTIVAASQAAYGDSETLNGGQALYIYSFGQGAVSAGSGWGAGGWGSGGWGTGTPITPSTGTAIPAVDWTMDNFGEDLIVCPIQPPQTTPFQPLYVWPPGQPTATVIPTAPPVNDGVFVAMPQRQVVVWGTTETGIQDPLLIRWSDVGNAGEWTDLVTNQAGQYRIPKGSRIVAALQGPQQGLILTDIDAWSMTYIGLPDVYGFNEIGTGCGLIARKAVAFVNGVPYWMGPSQFFNMASGVVQPMACSVWDFVYQNLDQNNLSKIRIAVNSRFGEISWYFPSITGGTGEVDSYVKFNYLIGQWDCGTLGRSAWVDQSVLGPPIGADPSSLYLYQHETSNDADGVAMLPSFQTGYFATAEGDVKAFVDWCWPDFKWNQTSQTQLATLNITFYVVDYPGDTPQVYGPYSVTQASQYFYTRFRGRLMSIKISSSDLGTWWRIGIFRYRFAPDGQI